MKYRKYMLVLAILTFGTIVSCRDESLYPLPYNDREVGAYLRMYSIASNVIDLNDAARTNTGFETIFEVVDQEGGNLLQEIEFYASFRAGTGLSAEVFVKSIPGSVFTDVPEPTYSEYKRATIRITYAETDAALDGAPAQPAGEFWPSLAAKINYPGNLAAGNQVIYRWKMILSNGKSFSVFNPQNTNSSENNTTANITGGQYYSAPFTFTMTARTLMAGAFIGDYRLEQFAIWSPAHSITLHQSAYPTYLNEVLFPAQTVTLQLPSAGLSTQREFQLNYRGAPSTMKINFEQSDPIAGNSVANTSAVLAGLSLSNVRPRGSVFVQLQNSTVDCSSERELYWVTPGGGLFGNTVSASNPTASNGLPAGLPQVLIPNRGVYFTDALGTTPGDIFYISVDDDCDEYGRRNGYCSWTRRVYLRLTKL